MLLEQFLSHYNISHNPFAEEDAQTDLVFRDHCIAVVYHPSWDKVYGDPAAPSTSIVFGEKGAGKTAMRLQMGKSLRAWNQSNPENRAFVVEYDDLNPFLDRFHNRVGSRKAPERALASWQLWDHMDAILSLAVTNLVDALFGLSPSPNQQNGNNPVEAARADKLPVGHKRDLLLLAAIYDHSSRDNFVSRWKRLKKLLKFGSFRASLDLVGGIFWSVMLVALVVLLSQQGWLAPRDWPWWGLLIVLLIIAGGWMPRWIRWLRATSSAVRITKNVRIGNASISGVRKALLGMPRESLAEQPLPVQARTDDRFDLLSKLQSILAAFGYRGIIVLMDRVDEPHLTGGNPDRMKALIWPLLDNKLLKHPGLGFKIWLPSELVYYLDRADNDFYQRARLDKQNVIRSFEWTPQSLIDVANVRIKACTRAGSAPSNLRSWMDERIGDTRLREGIGSLRVPRAMFKFLYQLLSAHANSHSSDQPVFVISAELFERELALFSQQQQAFIKGYGAG
jgi:hypothetical protein